ncbi:cold shock domain-containing protein [Pacificimonas pallii]|uniref:cold shock domain-containing protein n=1 Tax=Pacificimonas pallii TaxID=2827236 RepID=UPI0034E248BC
MSASANEVNHARQSGGDVLAGGEDRHAAEGSFEISGRVKWFDLVRGYGFIVPEDDDGDILVHFSCLADIGRRALPEGAGVRCIAVDRPRGRQALAVTEVDLSTAIGPDPEAEAQRAKERDDPLSLIKSAGPPESCSVKWFNRLKGYGFLVAANDTDRDIFVHMETVRRGGLTDLEPGQMVVARIVQRSKGPLAVIVEPPETATDIDMPRTASAGSAV